MKPCRTARWAALWLLAVVPGNPLCGQAADRETRNFNFDWRFHLGDIPEGRMVGLDDVAWRLLDLPHDWSIEGAFSKAHASGTGYLPGGIGWYRKSFRLPAADDKRRVVISFDGIYHNSEVWINGVFLGKRPNGYIPFQYDLTPHVEFGKDNLIAVKVDHAKSGDSRWYTGSGIYRDVKLLVTSPVHIGQWGVVAVARDVSAAMATLEVEVGILNESGLAADVTVTNHLMFGTTTVSSATADLTIPAGARQVTTRKLAIHRPRLWGVDDPNLYALRTVVRGAGIADSVTTPVGLRTIRFDADKGFFLNGVNLKLKGVCMHHDAGTLGAAVPRQVIARRLDLLKELGCNAIRTSHNPFAAGFLELCDEKGLLVIAEAFDEWELPKKKWLAGRNVGRPGKDGYAACFKEWAAIDLRDMILRDRNHPAIIMWSIGNEIDFPNDPYSRPVLDTEVNPQTVARFDDKLPQADRLGEIARELVAIVKQHDSTRPVTAGLASAVMSNETGYAQALDVVGYNYQEFRYARDHQQFPARILYGSENGMALAAWKAVTDNDYVAGQFLWSGFDFLGEAGQFPQRHSTAGIMDLAGNKKPGFYFRQGLWSAKPMVFIATGDRMGGTWNAQPGQPVRVMGFTNCAEVELFLNHRSLGIKQATGLHNRHLTWDVPFESGTLHAVGRTSGQDLASFELQTSGPPTRLIANSDVATLRADKQDLAHVFVTICDAAGQPVEAAENQITCEVNGPARLLGMEDSNPRNIEDYKDNTQHAWHGKLLLYVQALDQPGKVTIGLSAPGLQPATLELEVVR